MISRAGAKRRTKRPAVTGKPALVTGGSSRERGAGLIVNVTSPASHIVKRNARG